MTALSLKLDWPMAAGIWLTSVALGLLVVRSYGHARWQFLAVAGCSSVVAILFELLPSGSVVAAATVALLTLCFVSCLVLLWSEHGPAEAVQGVAVVIAAFGVWLVPVDTGDQLLSLGLRIALMLLIILGVVLPRPVMTTLTGAVPPVALVSLAPPSAPTRLAASPVTVTIQSDRIGGRIERWLLRLQRLSARVATAMNRAWVGAVNACRRVLYKLALTYHSLRNWLINTLLRRLRLMWRKGQLFFSLLAAEARTVGSRLREPLTSYSLVFVVPLVAMTGLTLAAHKGGNAIGTYLRSSNWLAVLPVLLWALLVTLALAAGVAALLRLPPWGVLGSIIGGVCDQAVVLALFAVPISVGLWLSFDSYTPGPLAALSVLICLAGAVHLVRHWWTRRKSPASTVGVGDEPDGITPPDPEPRPTTLVSHWLVAWPASFGSLFVGVTLAFVAWTATGGDADGHLSESLSSRVSSPPPAAESGAAPDRSNAGRQPPSEASVRTQPHEGETSPSQDTVKRDVEPPFDVPPANMDASATGREAEEPAAIQQEVAQAEATQQETAGQEAERQEAERQEAARREATRQDATRQEAARQEAARREAARQDAARQEAARQEAARSQALREAREDAARAARRQAGAQLVFTLVNDSSAWLNVTVVANEATYRRDSIRPGTRAEFVIAPRPSTLFWSASSIGGQEWTWKNTLFVPSAATEPTLQARIDTPDHTFALVVENRSRRAVARVVVNQGFQSEIVRWVSIAPGQNINCGLFPHFSNSNAYVYAADGSYWPFPSLRVRNDSCTVSIGD